RAGEARTCRWRDRPPPARGRTSGHRAESNPGARCRIVQDDRHRRPVASPPWVEGIAAALREPLLVATIRWGSIGPLVVTALAIMGSPGPATISLTAAGSAYGVRRSLAYLVGIIVGSTIVLVAVAMGITAALLAVPALRLALVAISVAYILWLAYRVA